MNISKKRSAKGTILIALMFLSVMSPKAWGYAQKELPSPSSEESFSSIENLSLSRAVLTDEKGVAICQVNLQENPEFLPQFAEAGSTDLRPLDLPECEDQNLDIVAQYAEQAWVKKDVAVVPFVAAGISFVGGCTMGSVMQMILLRDSSMKTGYKMMFTAIEGALVGLGLGGVIMGGTQLGSKAAAVTLTSSLGIGAVSAVACAGIMGRILYLRSSDSQDQQDGWSDMP